MANYGNAGAWGGLLNASNNALQMGMNLMQLNQERDYKNAMMAQTQQQNAEMNLYRQQQLAETQRQRVTAEKQQKLQEMEFYAKNPQLQPFDMTQFTQMDARMRMSGVPVDDLPFWNDLKAFAQDTAMRRGDVADAVTQKWPEWRAQGTEALQQKVASISNKLATLPENDPKRKELMGQIDKALEVMGVLEKIPVDNPKKALFPDIYAMEETKKAAQLKQAFDLYEKDNTLIAAAQAGDPLAQKALENKRAFEIQKAGAGRSVTNVINNIGPKGFTAANEAMGKNLVESQKSAMAAATSLQNIGEMKKLLNAGMITGTGATYLTNFGNALSKIGFKEFEDPVANTQAYVGQTAKETAQIIKQFGSGAGLSDADREYALAAAGGKITMNEKAIRKVLQLNEKANNYVIKQHNKLADQAMSKPESSELMYDLRVQVPGSGAGRSSMPAIGSIEGGYRFNGGNPGDRRNWSKVR